MTAATEPRQVRQPALPTVDAVSAAGSAGLRYVSDAMPGIRRRRAGKGFYYTSADGSRITDGKELARIRSLAIPPAWTDVWICPSANGHLQATGRDARGRKQYRYHPKWRNVRDETKYARLTDFGRALPVIRARVEKDLARPGLPREKVLAAVVRLLERTLVRIGNQEYARQNNSFGLTTLRNRHAQVFGSRVRFEFNGKSGKKHSVSIDDGKLARVIRRCRDLPGYELFQYVDDEGQRQTVDSADVNEYLREVSGRDFTAKDFRTWAGTLLAAKALRGQAFESETQARSNVVRAVEQVAERLANTPAITRNCYVHPGVVEAYMGRSLDRAFRRWFSRPPNGRYAGLSQEEAALLRLLARQTG